jgi:hypothetical protein
VGENLIYLRKILESPSPNFRVAIINIIFYFIIFIKQYFRPARCVLTLRRLQADCSLYCAGCTVLPCIHLQEDV